MLGPIIRGAKNAFRSLMRTASVTLILGISIGLSIIMLLSYTAVGEKISSVESSIGNQITVSPAGIQDFTGGGQPLTNDQASSIKNLPHVINIVSSISDRLSTSDTNLASPINPGSFGQRIGKFNRVFFGGGNGGNFGDQDQTSSNQTFSVPINVTGISATTNLNGTKIVSGTMLDASSDQNIAIVGKDLASKNSLNVGSTFTAYNTSIKVVGIFDAGSTFANAGIYMPLTTLQNLSSQQNEVTSVVATADSINNVDSVVSEIKNKLGSSNVDVVSTKDAASAALTPLQNIQSITLYSLIGALVAGSVITLLTMVMIVRERRREIGILKAIGSSNMGIILQFTTESFVFSIIGSAVGIVLGLLLSNPVLNVLVSTNVLQPTPVTSSTQGEFKVLRVAGTFGQSLGGGVRTSLSNLHTQFGFSIILFGLAAAIALALIGSAFPAWAIAKTKPANVLRSE